MRATAPRLPRHLQPVETMPDLGAEPGQGFALFLASLAGRVMGALLLAIAGWMALALWGWQPDDPSWNQATAASVANPSGPAGAIFADLLYQPFGYASWLLVLVLGAWAGRLLAGRAVGHAWWAAVVVLPLLILASASLAGSGLASGSPSLAAGGFVGSFINGLLRSHLGAPPALWLSGIGAFALLLLAIGASWSDSLWLLGGVARGSRRVGDTARAAGSYSGHAVAWGWRRVDGMIHRQPAADRDEEETEPRPAGWRARLGSVLGLLRRRAAADETEEETVEPAVRLRRRAAAAVEQPAAERPTPERAGRERPARRLRLVETTAEVEDAADDDVPPPAPAPLALVPSESSFELPDLDLLAPAKNQPIQSHGKAQLAETSRQLEGVLDDFGVRGGIVDAKPGPVVTLFELEPAPGTRAARVISLADDIARSLCALSVRVATVPGRNVIGIELPNESRETVYLRTLLEAEAFARSGSRLALALGKDISGNPIIVDLARMPHLLIAGTTGSGKSVAINAMILSLLYRLTPDECRIIMIDPKVIELSVYEGIPHLLAPVVTEPHKAVVALKWVVRQMDERYRLMSHLGVRDIFAFNRRMQQAIDQGEQLKRRVRTGFEPGTGTPIHEEQPLPMQQMPLIVVIVDEVADLMLTAGKEIENAIQRLSQKARAAGIHLIVATQRPSVDVLTGVIKANLPSRISFRVSSKIDSRTILGEPGAEQLLGQGDMLHLMPGDRISRIHGPLVTDSEVERVVAHLKTQGEPDYQDDVTREDAEDGPGSDGPLFDGVAGGGGAGGDATYQQAVQIVLKDGKASTSYLQRKLAIGYNSAAKLIERMEAEGVISHADHVGRRQVLMGRGGVDGTEPTDF